MYIIQYLQSLCFKLINFIFGKTRIFVVIIGWYLVITGLLFLKNPEKARIRLIDSGFGMIKINILLICFFLWGILTKVAGFLPGVSQALVFFGGLIAMVFFYRWLRKTVKNKLIVLGKKLSVSMLIKFAWGQVIVGGLMVYLQHRLW
jgi:hypothetical protein